MPELPDIVVYIERLRPRIEGQRLEKVRVASPFLLRTVAPPLFEVERRTVLGVRRLGKRIVVAPEADLLSGLTLTHRLPNADITRLFHATREALLLWTERLRAEVGDGFPEKVTAFREGMAVHGRFGRPCPVCGTVVQRIRYAENETNYCPRCQTGGKVLADRSLSRLLKDDWPRSIEELEEGLPT